MPNTRGQRLLLRSDRCVLTLFFFYLTAYKSRKGGVSLCHPNGAAFRIGKRTVTVPCLQKKAASDCHAIFQMSAW